MSDYQEKTPWWMGAVIVLCVIPALVFPFHIQSVPADGVERYLVWLYPAYVLGTGVCAWLCYPERKALAWILLALLLLSHAAMYYI